MNGVVLAAILLTAPAALRGQDPFRYRSSGYFTFGGGACQHLVGLIAAGGGAEAFVVKGLTVGASADWRRFSREQPFGTAVATVGYHFVNRNMPRGVNPFVSVAPIGIGFRAGCCGGPAGHIAGGMNYWFKDRMGIRFEGGYYGVATEVLFMVRLGLSFR